MKYSLFLSLILFMTISGISQNRATISGQILDGETELPLAYSAVIIQTAEAQLTLSGTLSGEDGRFSIEGVQPGNYRVIVSHLSYQSDTLDVWVGEKNLLYDLGKIKLSASTVTLDEVVIESAQGTVSSDLEKKSFSMDENFAQTGGSVLDAMKGLPGVTVDQEGKVMIRGSDKVAVLIDGKQSSLTGFGNQKGLDNIPAANIERIEIINNPSAKYDASGMAGIINIVYKKEKEKGFNGEVGFAYALGELTTRKADLPTDLGRFSLNPKYIPSLSLNYRTKKLTAFVQAEMLHQKKLPNNEFNTRTYGDGRKIISQVPENRTQTQYILKGGLDYQFNERNSLSVSTIFDYESHIDTSQVPYIDLITQKRQRYWHWSEHEVTGYMNYRLNYKHQFPQTGHTLDLSVQYTRGWEDEQYFLTDSSAIRQAKDTTHIVAIEHTSVFMADYVKPLRSGRLEAGTKVQIRRLPVTYTIGRGLQSVIYTGLGEWSDWGEDIVAGYLNYVWEKPVFEVEAGLRLEQTNVFYTVAPENQYYDENDSYAYFQIYPNVRFTYRLNAQNGLSLFYNRRVDRPGEPELRVFPKYDDPELMKVGNPYLRPQFTQTFELAYRHSWETGNVFVSAYHRIIDDPFVRVYSVDESDSLYNIVNRIYQNVGSGTNTGIEVLISQQVGKFWKVSGSFNGYSNVVNAYTGTLLFPYERPFEIERTADNTWDVKVNNQFMLPSNFQIQLTGVYYAPKNIAQGRQLSRSSVDIGIRKRIWNDKGEVVFSFSDIFNGFGLRQEIQDGDLHVLYENYYETQVARIGMNYKF